MNNDKKLRTTLIFFVFCTMYVIILGNLFYIQIIRRSFFCELGKQQYYVSIIRHPPRALIYDRHNKPIALNVECTTAFFLPKLVEHPQQLQKFLQQYYPTVFTRWKNNPNRYFLYIKRRVTQQEMLLMQKYGGEDIKFLTEPCRFYPSRALSTLVGITDIDNHGLFGIEYLCDKQLSGKESMFILERDARSGNFYFNKKIASTGKEGTALYLTIDSNLQLLAYNELQRFLEKFKAIEGGVVIIDPTNGDIITCVCSPDFDPNNTKELTQEHTKSLPFTQAYEVGSIIKVFAGMAALEEKLVTPDERIDCENKTTAFIDGMKVNTVSALGVVPFSEVIEKTNNIGIAKVTMRVGTKLYNHYKRLGFTYKTAVNFPGEQAGFITPPSQWSKRSIISLSFGYEIQTSMMQLAQAFGLIAHAGIPVQLRLFKSTPPARTREPIFSEQTISDMRKILTRTVEIGTAHRAHVNGYHIMGKTGTANMAEYGHYNTQKNIFTFCGIIEKGAYKRVVVTYIKEAKTSNRYLYASMVAVPLFERIAENMLIHDNVIAH